MDINAKHEKIRTPIHWVFFILNSLCTLWFYHSAMHPKDTNGMVNSVDPDQRAVSSASTLFSLTCLLE